MNRADTGAAVVLDYPPLWHRPHSVDGMDYRDETRVGGHTYGVNAKTEPPRDGQPATVAVEFTGADPDGRIVAEGNLLIDLAGLPEASLFLWQTLEGLAALNGQRPARRTTARTRPRPPNAGQPWTEEHGERLRRRWMESPATRPANELVGELAEEYGRTRSAIRAQVSRLGCDPDVPGRALTDVVAEPPGP